MIEATVTLKAAPADFDLLRAALEAYAEQQAQTADGRSSDAGPAERRKARELHARSIDMLGRLK